MKKGPLGALLTGRLLRQFLGRETWALADQAIVSGTNFLTNIMLARFMGLREFGIFALAWMTVLFANSMQNALIIAPMMSIGPKQEEKDRPTYFGAVIFQELVLVLLCFVLTSVVLRACSGLFHQFNLRQLALPLAVSALAYQGQDFVRRYFFVARKSHFAVIDDTLSYLTQLPIIFILHFKGHLNSTTALWAMAGTSLFGLAVGWFWVEPLKFQWTWIKAVSIRHWKLSRWLGASAVLIWTSGNLFVVAAPVYFGVAAAGVLKASQNLMGVTHVWFQGLDNVVPQEASRHLRDGGTSSMLHYIRSIITKWGGLTLAFAIVMGAAPGFWLRLVYGPNMAQYGYVLRLYAVLYLFIFIGGPLRAGLQALEFTLPIFWSYLCMTTFAVIFAVPAAKWLGLSGTMLGQLGTQLVFQSIVAGALIYKSKRFSQEARLAPQSPAATD